MTDVVVTDQAFGGVAREQAMAAHRNASFAAHQARTEDETVEISRGARILFVNFAPITRRVLGVLSAGAVVIRYGIGYDNVDVGAATELGISVCNVPDYGADTVADHTVALLLASLRKLVPYTKQILSDGWISPADLGGIRGFAETTVGLIGTGRIGRAVAARLAGFGFTIVAHDPYVDAASLRGIGIQPMTLPELLHASNVISLHAPLTHENRHTLDADAFSAMSPGTVVVNTSRGALIDEQALAQALQAGTVAAAALDVFEDEPLPASSPLREAPNVILTPHAAFFSDSSLANLQRLAAEEADRALAGAELRCRVN